MSDKIPNPPNVIAFEKPRDTCGNCKYCWPLDDKVGQCRKHPPQVKTVANPNYIPVRERESEWWKSLDGVAREFFENQAMEHISAPYPWPQMILTFDWCGSHQSRPLVKVAKQGRN